MYIEIKAELKVFQFQSFTGHIKFGIEKGNITTLYVSTLKTDKLQCLQKTPDFDGLLKSICNDKFYGTVEYDMEFGKIENLAYSTSWQGEDLRNRLRENQCKFVKVVVKK